MFTHESPAAAQAEADVVNSTGFTVGTTSISWVAPPHFYLKGSLLVLYVGVNGPQFAGADSSTVDPNSYTDARVQSYLGLMTELTSGLIRYSRSGSANDYIESITTVTTQLEDYTDFFAALDGEGGDYVAETYGDQLRHAGERLASIAATIQNEPGNETVTQALVRIPIFAISSVTSDQVDPTLTAVSSHIKSLLLPSEVSELAGDVEITTEYRDQMSLAANRDAEQVEHVISFEMLNFDTLDGFRGLILTTLYPVASSFATPDGFRGLTLTTIKLDSEQAAADHFELITGGVFGLQDFSEAIGDAASFIEPNEAGIGSMVIFRQGEWVVTLYTAQRDGITPLVDLAGVEALAQFVADRL